MIDHETRDALREVRLIHLNERLLGICLALGAIYLITWIWS